MAEKKQLPKNRLPENDNGEAPSEPEQEKRGDDFEWLMRLRGRRGGSGPLSLYHVLIVAGQIALAAWAAYMILEMLKVAK